MRATSAVLTAIVGAMLIAVAGWLSVRSPSQRARGSSAMVPTGFSTPSAEVGTALME
jgi:hypothetical protein